jgi:hypothetical protein
MVPISVCSYGVGLVLEKATVRIRGFILAYKRIEGQGIILEMKDKQRTPDKPTQTPFEKFTNAARHVFNVQTAQLKLQSPSKKKPRKRRKS